MRSSTWMRAASVGPVCVALAGPVAAATIYGSLSENQQPAANRSVSLVCPGQPPVPGSTDTRGSYRFTVHATGRCMVRVGSAEAPVILSVNPAQYNFELRNVGGRAELVQR